MLQPFNFCLDPLHQREVLSVRQHRIGRIDTESEIVHPGTSNRQLDVILHPAIARIDKLHFVDRCNFVHHIVVLLAKEQLDGEVTRLEVGCEQCDFSNKLLAEGQRTHISVRQNQRLHRGLFSNGEDG